MSHSQGLHSHIMATSGTSPKQGKCVQSNDMRKHKNKKTHIRVAKLMILLLKVVSLLNMTQMLSDIKSR